MGTPKSTTSLPVSFSDAINKAKAAIETENAREGNTPGAHTAASEPRKTEQNEDEEQEEVELHVL